jgi:hypothetical protein
MILSDSQAALRRLKQLGFCPGQALVSQIHDEERKLHFSEEKVEIEYRWVPSHCGIWGNEEADRAAREAATRLDVPKEEHWYSLAHISRRISEATSKKARLFITEHSSPKYSWNGKLGMKPRLKHENKRDAAVFWQFACGHALTGEYLKHKIRKSVDDTCWHCQSGDQQTRTHLFNKCSAFKEERKTLWRTCLKISRDMAKKKKRPAPKTLPLRQLFVRECYTDAVMEFLRATKIGRRGRPPEEDGEQAARESSV